MYIYLYLYTNYSFERCIEISISAASFEGSELVEEAHVADGQLLPQQLRHLALRFEANSVADAEHAVQAEGRLDVRVLSPK